MIRTLVSILGVAVGLGLSAGSADPAAPPPELIGRAYALKIVVPGQPGASVAEIGGSSSTASAVGAFAYPTDGSVARIGSGSTTLSVNAAAEPSVRATADVSSVSLFNGEITVDSLTLRAAGAVTAKGGTAGGEGSSVSNIVALGQVVPASRGATAALADWGTLTVLPSSAERVSNGPMFKGNATVVGLHVVLTAPHGGLPAGSEILAGFVAASASAAPPAPSPPPTTTPATAPKRTRTPPTARTVIDAARAASEALRGSRSRRLADPPEQQGGNPDNAAVQPIFRELPAGVNAELTPGRYVFPAFGSAGFGPTFGAPRAGTGWHHGEDIFGTLGQPILAVADGTIFSVGWNRLGGFRLWLRDRAGNQFYYAHMSAYSPLAVNGREVRAGQVIGFMGNTGQAQTTPVHLHFEIHPVSLLQFDYDGVIDAYPYLAAWQRLEDVSFAFGASWVPLLSVTAEAPKPGAILLQSQDISNASGLDPQSLRRALATPIDGSASGMTSLQE